MEKLARKLIMAQRKAVTECNHCQQRLKLLHTVGGVRFHDVIDHALDHIGRISFTCRHCEKVTARKDTIQRHVRKTHGYGTSHGHFKNLLNGHFDEIADMVMRCFGQSDSSKDMSANDDVGILRGKSSSLLYVMYRQLRRGQRGVLPKSKGILHPKFSPKAARS